MIAPPSGLPFTPEGAARGEDVVGYFTPTAGAPFNETASPRGRTDRTKPLKHPGGHSGEAAMGFRDPTLKQMCYKENCRKPTSVHLNKLR